MAIEEYKVIGLMSGTSLDGIDLVYVSIIPNNWSFDILISETIPYSKKWQNDLKTSIHQQKHELEALDLRYTNLLAKTILDFIQKNKIKNIDAICSHGHTVLHQPDNQITYQIGNLPLLSHKVGYKVVCNFRVQDVMYGGQGAPLVPIGDKLLFGNYDYCLNLGGFANISFETAGKRIAYDICPVNIVMNAYCKTLGLEFDDRGKIASKGHINEALLKDLNNLFFYSQLPPKSLGLEWVEAHIFPLIKSFNLSVKDVLRTFVDHAAFQISKVIKGNKTVLITGGGAYNDFLISRIKVFSTGEIIIPSGEIIEYKEALIFGLLGVLKMRNEVNCLRSVTGANKDHSSGNIFMP